MEEGFIKGQSDNLPRVYSSMVAQYFMKNNDFTAAKIRGIKLKRGSSPIFDLTMYQIDIRLRQEMAWAINLTSQAQEVVAKSLAARTYVSAKTANDLKETLSDLRKVDRKLSIAAESFVINRCLRDDIQGVFGVILIISQDLKSIAETREYVTKRLKKCSAFMGDDRYLPEQSARQLDAVVEDLEEISNILERCIHFSNSSYIPC